MQNLINWITYAGSIGVFLVGVACVLGVLYALVESIKHYWWLEKEKRYEIKIKSRVSDIVRYCAYYFPEYEDFAEHIFNNADTNNFRQSIMMKYNKKEKENEQE